MVRCPVRDAWLGVRAAQRVAPARYEGTQTPDGPVLAAARKRQAEAAPAACAGLAT